MRIVIIGNSGSGKYTLAKRLGTELGINVHEVDKILWRPKWEQAPEDEYNSAHSEILRLSDWVIEGLGRKESIEPRLARATHIVLTDFPLWQHFWLAAKRELDWVKGENPSLPAEMLEPPPIKALFETIWNVENDWLPEIRETITAAERSGKMVFRVNSPDDLNDLKIERE